MDVEALSCGCCEQESELAAERAKRKSEQQQRDASLSAAKERNAVLERLLRAEAAKSAALEAQLRCFAPSFFSSLPTFLRPSKPPDHQTSHPQHAFTFRVRFHFSSRPRFQTCFHFPSSPWVQTHFHSPSRPPVQTLHAAFEPSCSARVADSLAGAQGGEREGDAADARAGRQR
eukprot:3371106-Rhodomonas_salina.3